jgi:hypothetical protein
MFNSKVPYRISDIDLNKIKYTKIKSNERKTIIYLKYLDKDKLKNLAFQTPSLLHIFELKEKNNLYSINIPLYSKTTDKLNELINFLENLDNKIIQDAKNNSNWFNNFNTYNNMKYQKTILDCDKPYNKMIKLKIVNSKDFETLLQIENTNKISINQIPLNSWVKMILEIFAIWVDNSGFGLYIRPVLMSFTPINKMEYNYQLLDDSDEDIDDIVNTVNDNSIFIKTEENINKNPEQDNNITSVLEMPQVISDINSPIYSPIYSHINSSESTMTFKEELSETSTE